MKSIFSTIKLIVTVSSILFSVTEAVPLPSDDVAYPGTNYTLAVDLNFTPPSYISSRLTPPTVIPTIEKRADTVSTASASQIAEYTKYAGISATAYCRSVVPLNKWDCAQCLKQIPDGKLITVFDTPLFDTNGYVLRSDKEKRIYLVFRGTSSIQQAIDDLIFVLTDYVVPGAKVHLGFYASLKSATPYYYPVIKSQLASYPSYKVYVIGHSLGGAQAVLAAVDLYQRESSFNANNLFIHTAGSPRVGNPTFAAYVASTGLTYTRSVHKSDIVPHIPPKSWGYLHAGVEIWAKSSSNVQICASTIESNKCSNKLEPLLSTSIVDHLTYYGITTGVCL